MRKHQLLIVDDEPDLRWVLRGLIEDEGFDVVNLSLGSTNAAHQTRFGAAAARAELASLRVDSSRGEGSRADAARLEAAIGELALATRTVQRMLVEKGVCTREEFAQRLRQVDAEDGNVDGRAPLH